MEDSEKIEAIAKLRGYRDRAEMIDLTGIDPSLIDDNDESTWPKHKVDRTITVHVLAYGGFAIHEGDRHHIGMGWDEMLGHLAAMTIPETLKRRGHIYPMTTDAEDVDYWIRREERLQKFKTKLEP